MSKSDSTLAVMLPEIFPIVSSHLPLYTQPSTLLSLALTGRRLKEIVIPHMLYQQVWLDGEKRALEVLKFLESQAAKTSNDTIRSGDEIPVAHHIHRLCISSELSTEARDTENDAVRALRALIDSGALPNLVSLALHMDEGWYVDTEYNLIAGFGRLDAGFWKSLKQNCPKVKEISVTGLNDYREDRWVEDSGLFGYEGLESFRLQYQRHHVGTEDESPSTVGLNRLFDSLTSTSPFLHTLELSLEVEDPIDVTAEHGLFTRHFPHLRVLTLQQFTVEHPEATAAFWSSHPSLYRIDLSDVSGSWFEGLSTGVLPNLNILKAPFDDVRTLVPSLGDQLISLTFSSSINMQVPYLLRSVLPNGLSSLRSLGIYQRATSHSREIGWEASRWHEDEEGSVTEVSKRKAARRLDAAYVTALARGAPNLEELELIGECVQPIDSVGSALSNFSKLKRLYISDEGHGVYFSFIPYGVDQTLLEVAQVFARDCKSLESVTMIARTTANTHTTARIQRDAEGKVIVEETSGCGRVIGLGDIDHPGLL